MDETEEKEEIEGTEETEQSEQTEETEQAEQKENYTGNTSALSVAGNFVWRFLERFGAQIVSFVVSIVLARLLDPDVYGTTALVTVFTTILNVFVDSGFGNALIQKKDADDLDFSSVFYFNIVMCAALYAVMFFAAPLIATFYAYESLTPVVRVLSLTVVISGVKNVQQAYVSRTMQFKRFFWATLVGTLTSAVVGIALAYFGFGVWALVAQNLTNTTIDTIMLWFTVKWRPKKMFSLTRLKSLFNFGWKLLVSALLDTVYNELRQLVIGKVYSSSDLAYYNKGRQFPYLIIQNVNSSIDSVLLPSMSKEQDKKEHVKKMTRRAIKTSTYIMAPIMMGMFACAEPVILFLLTDKWADAIPFMRIFCVTFMFYPIHTANLNAIKAMGRSDYFLKLEIIKKCIGLALLFATMFISVKAIAYGMLASSFISQIVNAYPNRKLLDYGYVQQMKDILPAILLAVFMMGCVYCVTFLGLSDILTLIIQIPLGVLIYIGGSALLKLEAFQYLWNLFTTSIWPNVVAFLKKKKSK